MSDLYLASVVAFALAVLGGAGGYLATRRASRRDGILTCVRAVGFLVVHVVWVSDRLWVTGVLPIAGVPILGNALLLGAAAFLVGSAWHLIPGHLVRRGLLLVPLFALCAHRTFAPLWSSPPVASLFADRSRGGVCLQSTPATCSAAAAATLLRAHGIPATEAEMATLCLTTDQGTFNHGLYRGLKLKAAQVGWTVESFRTDAASLRHLGPAILNVRLDASSDVDPRYEKLWGWTPGVSHTVVVFGFAEDDDGKIEMGDPSVGREHWSTRDLHVLWRGEGLRLVKR